MIENLKKIKKVFDSGGNIIEYLKNINTNQGIDDMVLISYDFQAGSYIKKAEKNSEYEGKRTDIYAEIFNNLGDFDSIMEVGVGEGTTFSNIVPKLNNRNVASFGFDISYSRIQYGQKHLKGKKMDSSLQLAIYLQLKLHLLCEFKYIKRVNVQLNYLPSKINGVTYQLCKSGLVELCFPNFLGIYLFLVS